MRLFLSLAMLTLLAASAAGAQAPRAPVAVEEGYFEGADGVRLFYRRVGSGRDALVYLHGGPGSNFRGNGDFLEPLAPGRTLILYDQRGSGRSAIVTDPEQLETEDHVRDLEALRRHFGFARMSLAGLSWGSGLAALYAAAHPRRVQRLLLISPISPSRDFAAARTRHLDGLLGPAALARREAIRARLRQADDQETVALCREATDLTFRLYLVHATPENLRTAGRRCDIPPAAIRNRPVVEAATLASLGPWDFRPLLRRLRMPVLVMEGGMTNVPLDATRAWVTAVPNGRLLLIEGAGHEFFLDRPEAFSRAADTFLRGRFPLRSTR